MPIGTPSVPYRLPGSQYERWVDIYTRLGVERILFLGQEVTDGIAVCRRFPEQAAAGRLAVRLDTHGGRFLEGLDPAESYAVLERHAPQATRRYRSDAELRHLTGTGACGGFGPRPWP